MQKSGHLLSDTEHWSLLLSLSVTEEIQKDQNRSIVRDFTAMSLLTSDGLLADCAGPSINCSMKEPDGETEINVKNHQTETNHADKSDLDGSSLLARRLLVAVPIGAR